MAFRMIITINEKDYLFEVTNTVLSESEIDITNPFYPSNYYEFSIIDMEKNEPIFLTPITGGEMARIHKMLFGI